MDGDSELHSRAAGARPLVVDLDGTYLATDSLLEAVIGLVLHDPSILLRLPGWLGRGRAGLKAEVADRHIAQALPVRPEVVDLIEAARAEGRPVVLATAADRRQAEALAAEQGLFDAVLASEDGVNLKGAEKARALVARYGAGGFDYAGDSPADLAVWAEAQNVITVAADARLQRAAARAGAPGEVRHIAAAPARAQVLLRALRPHQWSKNLLVLLPALAAHAPGALPAAFAAFVAFSLTASAVYLINDLVDLDSDRAHPRKRNRPFASGALPLTVGLWAAPALIAAALLIGALFASPGFLAALAAYFVATFAYSMWLKRKLVIDVITLAGLYTVRIVAGAAAAAVMLSPWMLGFSMFLFLALAAVKRQGELTDQISSGRGSAGRAYEAEDLPVLRGIALAAVHAAVLVLALYISSEDVQRLYDRPDLLWLVCPILLYWALRMVMKAHRGLMTDDPIVFAGSDRISQATILTAGAIVLAAV
ncbi:MAG: UbiA family prenyltransferase [Paracoccaceae bacterium]|nr:UbiA family prenyltransferase [Paracoccaceae bacterium]